MRALRGFGAAGLALATSIALAAGFAWNRIISGSVDITYHLQVLDAVRHGGLIPASARAYMSEMYGYPDLGHRMAAAGTWLGLADLNALALTGCFAAALVWFLLLDQARRAGLFVLVAGGALAAANAALTNVSFGAEVVSNFFFSQVFGEAFAIAALVLAQPLLARSRTRYIVFVVIATALCGGTHLIPTLHLAGAAMAILGVQGLRELVRERRIDWLLLAGIAGVALAVVANPGFWGMRVLSTNDGVVGYGVEFGFAPLAAAELVLLTLSGWVLLARALDRETPGPPERAAVLLAALGAAAAAAGLAQMASFLLLGESSTYAVKKQAFGVGTMLCLVLPLWMADLARLRRPGPNWSLALVVLGQATVIALLFSRPGVLDVRAVDKLLADARALRTSRGLEQTDILFASGEIRPLVSYIVGSASLRRRRDGPAEEVLKSGFPVHSNEVTRIATLVGDMYDKPACRQGPPVRGLVVVGAACAELPSVKFKAGGDGGAYLTEGWSGPEPGGVWSLGRWAVVDLPIPAGVKAYSEPYVEIALFGFVPAQSPERKIWLTVGPDAPEQRSLTAGKQASLVYEHPLTPDELAKGMLRVVFEVENPVSPASLGLGDDPRRLGIGLEQIRFLPRVR